MRVTALGMNIFGDIYNRVGIEMFSTAEITGSIMTCKVKVN